MWYPSGRSDIHNVLLRHDQILQTHDRHFHPVLHHLLHQLLQPSHQNLLHRRSRCPMRYPLLHRRLPYLMLLCRCSCCLCQNCLLQCCHMLPGLRSWCLPVMQKLLSFSFGVLLVIYVLFACSVVAFVQAYEESIVFNHTFCLKLSHFRHTFLCNNYTSLPPVLTSIFYVFFTIYFVFLIHIVDFVHYFKIYSQS